MQADAMGQWGHEKMDGYALIDGLFKSFATMIGAVAWPVAYFGVAWLFRNKLVPRRSDFDLLNWGVSVAWAGVVDQRAF